jgi:hypothetical protein
VTLCLQHSGNEQALDTQELSWAVLPRGTEAWEASVEGFRREPEAFRWPWALSHPTAHRGLL